MLYALVLASLSSLSLGIALFLAVRRIQEWRDETAILEDYITNLENHVLNDMVEDLSQSTGIEKDVLAKSFALSVMTFSEKYHRNAASEVEEVSS